MAATATRSLWQMPRIERSERWVGGVSAALAREIGVQPLVIRTAFVALALVAGWGLLLYVLAWGALGFFSSSQRSPYTPTKKGATSVHRHVAIALIVVGLVIFFGQLSPQVVRSVTIPIGFVLAGGLIAWTRGDEVRGATALVRIVAGLSVAAGGAIALATLSNLSVIQIVTALIVGVAVVAAITIVAAPSVIQMGRALDDERLERIRTDEKARISAHLHDSVLQTLTLIQRNSDDPAKTAALARQQERELRTWLYGVKESPGSVHLGQAIEQLAGEVERMHNVKIEVISVGDTGAAVHVDLSGLIAATGEAMTNAAVHSGVDTIDVFIERNPKSIEIFVRDTGTGFDQDLVGSDRRGISESIIGRMQRAGGHASVNSSPGAGTEVELCLPLSLADSTSFGDETGDEPAATERTET